MLVNGKNLKILIDAIPSAVGDWSAFALCYSIRKFLPEAEIYLTRNKLPDGIQYFKWMNKLKVKHGCSSPDLKLPSTCMIIRPVEDTVPFNLESLLSEAKLDKFTPFVSYNDGCARFVMSDWINSNEYPFPYADKLANQGMCPNELQVLKLWKQINTLYPMLVKG